MRYPLLSLQTAAIITICLFFFQPQTTYAQCSKSGFSAGTATAPSCSNQNFNAGSGTYVRMSVTSGVHYTFSSSSSPFTVDMTGYNGASTVFAGNNGASVGWTASFTGNLDVMMNRDNCQGHDFTGQSAVLTYVKTAPTTANAGADQTACNGSANSAANTPSIGSGLWSVVSGSGSFISASDPTTTIYAMSAGNNTFRWTIDNGGCASNNLSLIHI